MAEDKIRENYAKLGESMIEIALNLKQEKVKLVRVVIEDADSKSSLNKLRRMILEYQVNGATSQTSCEEENTHTMPELYRKMFTDIPIQRLELVTETMKTVFKPLVDHRKLLDKIADVIRSDLPDDSKIEKISDLLM